MAGAQRTLLGSTLIPLRLLFLMWFVFAADYIYAAEFSQYGIIPRTTNGLIGIFTAPVLHGSFDHIMGNSIPLLVLGATLFYFYPLIASRVFLNCYLFTGLLVWLLARPSTHIGASGLIYGVAGFLIGFGLARKDLYSILISFVIILLYGGLIYGVLPGKSGVSWEGHLFGAIVGVYTAWRFRHKKYI